MTLNIVNKNKITFYLRIYLNIIQVIKHNTLINIMLCLDSNTC